ncbi:MAG TPA: non-canonical purine NTP pyrophosphatase [Candidatus Acidoferrum sp.]|jgi:XTP/dITP diphosphohydrolase|nr:non-canonical purine NTP pyrophosphatase [Candidatus Acidoferrum sp.]
MTIFLIATRNEHKVGEIRTILGDGFECLSLREFPDAPEVVEDGVTFAANSTKKSIALAKWLAEKPLTLHASRISFVLADDSGLEVDALQGKPGVHSARFAALDTGAAGNSSPAANNAKLLRLLKGVPMEKRTGRFRCVLALMPVSQATARGSSPVCYADELEMQTELFEGACEGRIEFEPRGQGGFGYDPLFVPVGYDQTFAELGEEVKNGLSHRAKALAKLRERLGRLG